MQENTATAFLIHGYLGAGKTTLARRLEVERAAIRFTHDEWMRSLYGDDPPETRFLESAKRVSGVMETVWTRCVALKMNVVLEFGFWTRSERERVRDLVASLGGNSVLYGSSGAVTTLQLSAQLSGLDGMRVGRGNVLLITENRTGKLTQAKVEGDEATLTTIKDGLG
jgi:hypothetical protein